MRTIKCTLSETRVLHYSDFSSTFLAVILFFASLFLPSDSHYFSHKPLFWTWLPWLLIEGARSAWAVNQQRMIIRRVIICLSAAYILCSFDSRCFKVPGSIRYLLLNPGRIWPLISATWLSFRTVCKALDLLLMWFLFS